jgi:hypothetical protein
MSIRDARFTVVYVSPEGERGSETGIYRDIEGMFPVAVTQRMREQKSGRCSDCGWKYSWQRCDTFPDVDLSTPLCTGNLTVQEQIELLRPFR